MNYQPRRPGITHPVRNFSCICNLLFPVAESLVGALVSTGKSLSIALNNEPALDRTDAEENLNDTTPAQQVHQTQSSSVPPLGRLP
jgi:hypothetical protein